MQSYKPFDPNDIDETLTRIVSHGDHTYLMFPYINAMGSVPEFNSISHVIDGPAATVRDFSTLTQSVKQAAENASWFISFNTPWLMPLARVANIVRRQFHGRRASRR